MESTAAILLRKTKLSDTSLIVSWCTESLGRIQTVAKGARRPKSPFAGKLDLFFQAEIAIARSRKSNLHTLTEVSLIETFGAIREHYARTRAASYFVELIELASEPDHPAPELFRLLARALRYLDSTEPNRRAVFHFESELARLAGIQRGSGERETPATAIYNLFGKLPAARAGLLKSLATTNDVTTPPAAS